MSLNKRERAATSEELHANLELAGLGVADLERALGLDDDRIEGVLGVTGADPVDVWLVRDYLERVLLERGVKPRTFTVLTPAARVAAEKWFALYDVDEVLKEQ
ncbi:hypothetical protein HD599_002042 [Conyzicola lurida]|uniref:DUF2316 family protein n=1 Tax=Conyzicola lurida TaxID=1172621 RepID=A0A841AQM1_9MICO|nr:DUF2316 family protein [Conyzicola lurida]MBB5843719.1 hypothetical protein [Conyzicola lurida]